MFSPIITKIVNRKKPKEWLTRNWKLRIHMINQFGIFTTHSIIFTELVRLCSAIQ